MRSSSLPAASAWRGVFLLAALALVGLAAAPGGALAQDEAAADEPAAAVDAGVAGEGAEAAPAPRRSYLMWMYNSLGPMYSIAFLAMSFLLVASTVKNVVKVTRANLMPPDLVEAFEAHLGAKQYSEAYDLASGDDSFLAKVLAAGLGRLSGGGEYSQAVEAMQEVGEEQNLRFENGLSHIALIGVIAPMVGLLGTVHGMVNSFDVIATSPTTPKPSELAEGIATALWTTLVGLVIAIPAIIAYNLLRNHLTLLVHELGVVSEGLMNRFRGKNGVS